MSNLIREVVPRLGDDGAIRISRNQINEFVLNHVRSDWDWTQSVFKPFNYMTINRNGKYSVTGITGSSRFLRKYKGCVIYSHNGSTKTNMRNIDSCAMYMLDHYCQDDFISGCYEHLLNYSSDGEVPTMTEEAQRLFDMFLKSQARDYKLSTWLTLTLGNAFPDLESMLVDDISYEEKENLLHGQTDSCDGWFTQLHYMAQDSAHSHLNVPGVINKGEFSSSCKYDGDIYASIEELICNAKPKLQDMISAGNYNTPMDAGDQAQIWMDRSYYNALIQAYEMQCRQPMQNCELIVKKTVTAMGMTKDVYYIKNMPVLCIDPLSGLNGRIKGTLRFLGIVINGTIQIGSNMGDLGTLDDANGLDSNTGLRVKRLENYQVPVKDSKGNIKELGLIPEAFLTSKFVLSRTVIVDPDCMVSAYAYDPGSAKVITS